MKGCTNRIRIELMFGALTLRELASRCGIEGPGATHKIIPFVWQLEHRSKEVVKLPGKPNRYALARQRPALAEVYR